jgi:hypothetical protein
MSYTGGDGGHEIGGGGVGSGPSSSCDTLGFDAALSSPDPAVVSKLKVDWILRIESRAAGGTKVAVAVIDGRVVGTLTSPEAIRLIDCMDEGHTYYASILEIKGGLCRIRIRHS